MMTRDLLRSEMAISETAEEQIYKTLTLSLFREIQEPLKELYEQTVMATNRFNSLTSDVLRTHPWIIKTLRYCLAPVISQMRLGQLIGLDTTEGFEEQGSIPTTDQADRLARWFNDYLDRDRFQWLINPHMPAAELGIAESYAKLWTVSLQSNQNTATKYRTQRKERQEQAIAVALQGMGLIFQAKLCAHRPPRRRKKSVATTDPPPPRLLGGIDSVENVLPNHYVKEKKILGGSQKKQKSDLTARPSTAELLFCIEAKAVGIKLDSTKRLKELNDKYTDWEASNLPITTVGVLAGMFSEAELVATIKERKIPIFFEHNLAKLVEFLRFGLYYDSPWDPNSLFPDVSELELTQALANIQTAPVEASTSRQADDESGQQTS
jgi:hypothetical protein